MIDDYNDKEKIKFYEDTMETPFIKDFRLYTLLNLIDFKDKIVLDCPCSTGAYTEIFLEKGAKYVIGSDIVQEQINIANQRMETVYPKYSKKPYSFITHDSKIPKQLINNFVVDIAIILHLFCFADNYEVLLDMVKFVYMNLKDGGKIVSFHCVPIYEGKEKEFEKLNGTITKYDKYKDENNPGYLVNRLCNAFNIERFIYPNEIVEKALKEIGFKNIKYIPYQIDPNSDSRNLLERHISTCDYYYLEATK